MRIKTLCIGLQLFVVLAVHPVSNVSAESADVINAALPGLVGFISVALASSPAAPFLVAGLGLIHVLSMILLGEDSAANDALSRNDLLNTQHELMNKLNDIDAHISDSTSKIINELGLKIESHTFLHQMRIDLESFSRTYKDKMPHILDTQKSAMARRTIESMINYDSTFRVLLRSFITTYIKPTVILPTNGRVDLFFDFILRQNQLLALENDDCSKDSLHDKIFKSYIYITKVLTDSYAMVLSAHVAQYQQELRQSDTLNADGTKAAAVEILEAYKNDMKILMEKTQWALENSSREIKNCGSFELKEGENYARLPFVTTVAKFKKQHTLNLRKCILEWEQPVRLSSFNVARWRITYTGIPSGTDLEVYYNSADSERPFSHVKFAGTTLGHADGVSSSLLTKIETGYCSPDFFNAYNKNPAGISTQRVGADPGNVITGVRFRVRKNILYVDIQQGKFISELEVDPHTVHWKETPESPHVAKLDRLKMNKIEIADHEVDAGQYLTAIQLQGNFNGKIIELHCKFEDQPQRAFVGIGTMHEIKLIDRDDPAKIAAGAKRLISRNPNSDIAHIKFQTTSFRKDLGRTTIPYIDTREVVTNPPSPLIGIGIYHEAAKGDGGLLALKLIQPRLTKYVDYSKLEQFTRPEVVA